MEILIIIVLKNLATTQLLVDGGLDNMWYIIKYYEAQKIVCIKIFYIILFMVNFI